MCSTAINLTSRALNDVGNAEVLLKIKGFIALFIQTMEVNTPAHSRRAFPNFTQGWGYSISTLDTFLLALFDKYAELLKHRFSEDFQEVSASMPKQSALLLIEILHTDCIYGRLHANGHQFSGGI